MTLNVEHGPTRTGPRPSGGGVIARTAAAGAALWLALAACGCAAAWDPETGEPLADPRFGESEQDAGPGGSEIGGSPGTGAGIGTGQSGAGSGSALGADRDVVLADRLADVQPADIYVLPIDNQSSLRELELDAWRERLVDGLIGRLYSPLALDYADARRAELAAAGRNAPTDLVAELGADALLAVRLLAWDETQLEARGQVLAEVEALLVDPARGALEDVLWGHRLARRIELPARSVRNASRAELRAMVLMRLTSELMERLPERNARAAPRPAAAPPSEPDS